MIDLHVHTNVSDNSFSIEEVIKKAKNDGVTHLAVTDHDTTKGIAEAAKLGRKMGVTVIPGIEVSAYDYRRQKNVHILGLYVQEGHPTLDTICASQVQKRHQASLLGVIRLRTLGYDLTWEDVEKYAGGSGVFKQHIMHALLDKGYCDRIHGDFYKRLFSKGNVHEPAGVAYIPLNYVDVRLAINAVKEAGGVSVLAHPGYFGNFEGIDEWVNWGLQGIEVFHPLHTEKDRRLALEYAWKYGLYVTGGSNFHGFYDEVPIELGCRELNAEWFTALASRERNKRYEQG